MTSAIYCRCAPRVHQVSVSWCIKVKKNITKTNREIPVLGVC